MAASATPRNADTPHRVVAVAYSAGRDSTALLHATVTAAAASGVQVVALHVHHGLSAHADEWLAHAQAQCERWARRGLPVHLKFHRLAAKPARGESIEAWARQARYRALREMALEAGAQVVLLAHHRRDQAETWLLQALRGAGVAGLAGMPQVATREGISWARPWLKHSRDDIEAYVRRHRLRHVDDDSNVDDRFARNRLRLQVWPALTKAFAQAEISLAESAAWAAEACACLDELAALDLARMAESAGLKLDAWRSLSPARGSNALRVWLKAQTGLAAPASLVMRLQREIPPSGSAQWPLPGGTLHCHRGRLRFVAAMPPVQSTPPREATISIRRAGRYELAGWGGFLVATRTQTGGVTIARLANLELRERTGGEQFQAGPGRPPRSLKKQFQSAQLAAWERDGPLLYSAGALLFVPGLGLDARIARESGPQLDLRWEPASYR